VELVLRTFLGFKQRKMPRRRKEEKKESKEYAQF
jgi:hypothetical protein